MKTILIIITILLCFSGSILCWDGYDYDTGSYVEIDSGNLVRPGNDIEIYDYNSGSYHDVNVESINTYGSYVEIEVYDWDTGDYRTIEMDN